MLVPEIVEHIDACEGLIQPHSDCYLAVPLSLEGEKREVEHQPEDHGHPVGDEFDVEASDSGV